MVFSRDVGRYVGRWVGRSFLVRSCLLITLIKCLKGHKFLGSLCSVVKSLIVSCNGPMELFWTAKKPQAQKIKCFINKGQPKLVNSAKNFLELENYEINVYIS